MYLKTLLIAVALTSCSHIDQKVEQYDFTYNGQRTLTENQEFDKFSLDDQYCNQQALAFAQARQSSEVKTKNFMKCMNDKGWSADLRQASATEPK